MLSDGIEEIQRIESLLSEFRDGSVTAVLNKNAGKRSIEVPPEVYQLIRRCLQLSALTQGAFDITVKPLKSLYDFKRKSFSMPEPRTLKDTLEVTGYHLVKPGKNNRVYLSRPGMEISFASIGKGYAADRVRRRWLDQGVERGVINASGDLSVIGRKIDGSPWKIGIADPEDPSKTLLYIPLKKGSVATSGNYEQYFMHDGRRHAHTIDPKTGIPVTGIKSVTVSGPNAELCDALATSLTVMGVEAGLYLIDQLPDTHCLIIDDQNKLHSSENIIFEKAN
jgi:thiamine biosynthesis lipoprotein